MLAKKIRRLEQRYMQQQHQMGLSLKPVPEKWEDFVSLCTIRSGGRMLQFQPYEYQKLLSRLMDDYNNIVVVKSRQLGTTQCVISKFLHRASVSPAYSSMAFLRSQEDASAIARRARQMLEGLKEYVRAENDNVGFLKLQALGELYFKNSSKEGSRSYDSVLDFLFDESAFSPNIEQIYAASSPSGALAGDLITKLIVSTPSSKSGWYWGKLSENNGDLGVEEVCKAVAAGELWRDIPGCYWWVDEAGVVKLVLHWRCHPVYNQKPDYLVYRQQQDGTDEETISREYDLKFIDSSVSVFSSDIVRANAVGSFENWRDEDADYYFGLDTSTTGSDYCVAVILKYKDEKYSLVALYRKRQQTSDYHIYNISELINKYKPVIGAIELTGGVGTLYLEQLSRQFKYIKFEGIRTTGDSKPTMISTLQLALEKQNLSYPAKSPIVDELLSFRRDGAKLQAASGKFDDIVMSLSFALAVSPFNKERKPFIDISKIGVWDGK